MVPCISYHQPLIVKNCSEKPMLASLEDTSESTRSADNFTATTGGQKCKMMANWFLACDMCAYRQVGQCIRPPLVPLPVAGAFDHVGEDVIQFVYLHSWNDYAVVFINYLMK